MGGGTKNKKKILYVGLYGFFLELHILKLNLTLFLDYRLTKAQGKLDDKVLALKLFFCFYC